MVYDWVYRSEIIHKKKPWIMGPNIGLIGEHDHAEVSTDWFKGKKNTETTEICSANEGLSA